MSILTWGLFCWYSYLYLKLSVLDKGKNLKRIKLTSFFYFKNWFYITKICRDSLNQLFKIVKEQKPLTEKIISISSPAINYIKKIKTFKL